MRIETPSDSAKRMSAIASGAARRWRTPSACLAASSPATWSRVRLARRRPGALCPPRRPPGGPPPQGKSLGGREGRGGGGGGAGIQPPRAPGGALGPSSGGRPALVVGGGGSGRRGRRGRRRVVELLLGAEERVEHLVAQVLAQREGQAGADDADEEQLADAALAALLGS